MDRYQSFAGTALGRLVVRKLGLPAPHPLRRHVPGQPLLDGPVLLGGGGRLRGPVGRVIAEAGVRVVEAAGRSGAGGQGAGGSGASGLVDGGSVDGGSAAAGDGAAAAGGGVASGVGGPAVGAVSGELWGALVFDATGIDSVARLRELHAFFQPVVRSLAPCGRVVVLGSPPEGAASRAAQRALEGFTRSLGKELRRGATAQLVQVAEGAEGAIGSTVEFLLSGRSAYVSGQVVRIGPAEAPAPSDRGRPLDGQVALVTGAARGIGAAIAEVLGRDGAHVVCLDVPASGAALAEVANRVRGSACHFDITAPDAPRGVAELLAERHGGVDVVVHNAGITRDRTLGRMTPDEWDAVLSVNLAAQERLNGELLRVLRRGGRVVGVSSIGGVAGNAGQTNYAASKAGVIGLVEALSEELRGRGTANAVAPGFIETAMTAAMPLLPALVGRRLNSVAQGGLPVDVAEAVAWLAHPASGGVTGNVVRVCGQSLLGA
ncbi:MULTISPECIES: 3-oxoacyl-ACP reductase [Actinosynnema]|uniref:3-oxoacyl-ACP reductase n=1 Tax=Actinosynnema TaxID=40566 RepID=UPI0020A46234|nr:3-oxoacyl-ACP reductase [Actinosynnema pretiosum]MCP2093632.1 3-oxoacyl-[acyl-carrier protein] reductase [Actinosynnema pretiosum]